MAPRRAPESSDRLRRILLMVPYVTRRGGASFEELEQLTGASRADLAEDLDVLFMTGTPPYLPGDMVDVTIDGDRVSIAMADQIARPLRLSRAEALALFVTGTALRATLPTEAALTSALGKISKAIAGTGAEALEAMVASTGDGGPTHLAALRGAAERRRIVEIDYYAASTGERTHRRVEPHEVFNADGRWYVAAWDPGADDGGGERLLRVDRVLSLTETDERFERRDLTGAGRGIYMPSEADVDVVLLVRPKASWVGEYYRASAVTQRSDGWLEVAFRVRHLGGVERMLLRLGDDARVVAPSSLAASTRALADRMLARYRSA